MDTLLIKYFVFVFFVDSFFLSIENNLSKFDCNFLSGSSQYHFNPLL